MRVYVRACVSIQCKQVQHSKQGYLPNVPMHFFNWKHGIFQSRIFLYLQGR